MKQEKLEYLQKKYESRLTPADEKMLEKQAQPKSGPGHKHAGHLAAGKPKNMKKTINIIGLNIHGKDLEEYMNIIL